MMIGGGADGFRLGGFEGGVEEGALDGGRFETGRDEIGRTLAGRLDGLALARESGRALGRLVGGNS